MDKTIHAMRGGEIGTAHLCGRLLDIWPNRHSGGGTACHWKLSARVLGVRDELLKLALEHLGFGPCRHMFEVRDNPSLLPD